MNKMLKALYVLAWILFIGLCIRTGVILVTFLISIGINPEASSNLYEGLDLSSVMDANWVHYTLITGLIISIWALKSWMLFGVIQIFQKLKIQDPFHFSISKKITQISHVALLVGVLSILSFAYGRWLVDQGLMLNHFSESVRGGMEFLFMAGIFYVFAVIFRRGVEIQQEHELTI
ncbi:Protein of unknown function [Algoriphagus ornithinivorans]|uniref:DUF2975 domain-containing protein n=1 Tax=Algoriphagus ornithinivorans TaxID=226506 RepID=A0A1I5J5S0_9BACT|nr:DUF2975 domain-containing protein [Algoriphagus ornithinivorans]SFO68155.1 Protein of unknown function [Algoriphagus ornithinivorans]